MKKNFSKTTLFLSSILFASVALASLGIFAIDQSFEKDPDLIMKIENTLQERFNDKSIRINIDWHSGASDEVVRTFDLPIQEVRLKTTTGDIRITSIKNATHATVKVKSKESTPWIKLTETKILEADGNTTYGNADLLVQLPENFNGSLLLATISGDIHISDTASANVDIKTVSGEIDLRRVGFKTTKINTFSGDINLVQKDPGEINIESISGDVDLDLSKLNEGYLFEFKTFSGKIRNKVQQNSGNGGKKISISTTSGDIRIQKSKEL